MLKDWSLYHQIIRILRHWQQTEVILTPWYIPMDMLCKFSVPYPTTFVWLRYTDLHTISADIDNMSYWCCVIWCSPIWFSWPHINLESCQRKRKLLATLLGMFHDICVNIQTTCGYVYIWLLMITYNIIINRIHHSTEVMDCIQCTIITQLETSINK